jgi:hypothetical protein
MRFDWGKDKHHIAVSITRPLLLDLPLRSRGWAQVRQELPRFATGRGHRTLAGRPGTVLEAG